MYPNRLVRFGTRFIERIFNDHGVALGITTVLIPVVDRKNALLHSSPETLTLASSAAPAVSIDLHRQLVEELLALVTSFAGAGKLHRMRRG